MAVLAVQFIPLLVTALVAALLVVVIWAFWRTSGSEAGVAAMSRYDRLLIALLVLALFTLGLFVTYAFAR